MRIHKVAWNIITNTHYLWLNRNKELRWSIERLREIELALGGNFDNFTFKKITESYSVFMPLLFDAFTALRARPTSKKEKERLLHYFICSSLFDNFCDNDALSSDNLHQISFFPENYVFTSFEERAFIQSNIFLRNNILDAGQYEKICKALYNSQIYSATQFDSQISEEEIKNITRQKGGYSLMLCSFYLDEISSATEQQCWYHIGEIIQLNDDLFDIYKDCNDKISTLANRMQDAYAFHKFFIALFKNIEKEILSLPYPNKAKQKLINSVMGISSIGLVAIRHLQKIQRTSRRLLDLKTLTYNELIIDMEKITNRLRCIKWYLKLQTSKKAV